MARIRRLSGSATRRQEVWTQPASRGHRVRPLELPKLGVRRLMKRDPAKGTSQPFYDKLTETPGVAGLSGKSPVFRVLSKARTAASGAGVKRVRNRGTNKSLKKR